MSDTATVLGMSVYAATTQSTLHTTLLNATDSTAPSPQDDDAAGDTVRISEEAQALAQGMVTAGAATQSADAVGATEETDSGGLSLDSEDDDAGSSDSTTNNLEKQIETLQEQVQEVKDDDTLSEEEKNLQVLTLQAQIAQLEAQLQNAQSESSFGFSDSDMTSTGSYGAST